MAGIGRSLGEFLWRALRSWWTRVAAALAIVAFLLEKLEPRAHVSGRTWLWILVIGAALSLVAAYHETRVERDSALAGAVAPEHGKELTDRLRLHLSHVENREPSYYVDATPGGVADRESFCAHYRERCAEIDRWNDQINQEALYAKIKEEIRREAESDDPDAAKIDPRVFDVSAVVDHLWVWVFQTAREGKLDDLAKLRWRHHDLPDRWDLEMEGNVVGALPAGTPDAREGQAKAARAEVFALAEAIRGWDDARKITESKEAAERLRAPLLRELDLDLRAAEDLRRSRTCAVCWRHQRPQSGPSRLRTLREKLRK